jgi:hypothetical protein
VWQERKVAVDSLREVEAALEGAKGVIRGLVAGRADVADYHQPDAFFKTVGAAGRSVWRCSLAR